MRIGYWVGVAALLGAAGCAPREVAVSGRVVKDGAPLKLESGEDLQVVFHPKDPNGVMCLAAVGKDGKFKFVGPTGGNVPVGTYRVELVESYSNVYKGEFTGKKSPLVYEAAAGKPVQTVVVDVGKKTVTGE